MNANDPFLPNRSIEQMVKDLEASGWSRWRGHMTVWQAPTGDLYRGPALAWKLMMYGYGCREKGKKGGQ